MRQTFTFLFLLSFIGFGYSQLADFEDFSLEQNSFLNGSDFSGGYTSGDIFFPNNYFATYNFWTGFSVSNVTDKTTPGAGNQYASYAGEGANGSSNFAVGYASTPIHVRLSENSKFPVSIYLTNSTYTALSMRDGDSFAKKFGGESGDDPDFYFVTIRSWLDGELSTDSINHYLADYRSSENSLDYISDTWDKVDLTSFGETDSLQFRVYSSDVGGFGINTPTYFCLDDLITDNTLPVSTNDITLITSEIYPNPVYTNLRIKTDLPTSIMIDDASGKSIYLSDFTSSYHEINMTALPTGIYFVKIIGDQQYDMKRVIKY